MMKMVMKDIFLKEILDVQENCLIFIGICHFYLKERKSKSVTSLFVPYSIKKLSCAYTRLNHGLILKKVHRVIQFNQKAWVKSYIDMNIKLRTEAKTDFEKDFFKLMNNAVFGKTMENVRKHRDIKLVTTDKRRNQLVSEPNYHTTKYFSENLLAIEMKKTKVKMNKPVYLGMSILDISKTLMYEFWYDYIKPKYQWNGIQRSCAQYKAKICSIYTDSFLFHIKTEHFYEDIVDNVENGLTHLTMTKMTKDRFQ